MVEELKSYTSQDLADLDVLMHELSPTSYCNEAILYNVMNDNNSHVFVIREEGHIIATGTLCIMHMLEFTIAGIESVVVKSNVRGKGYGKELITHMIHTSNKEGAHHIQLTSNPLRKTANKLYQSMGFEKYDTNCYKYKIIV